MRWIKDEAFIRGKVPMTKFEVRAATLAMLDVEPGDILLDVGAGTGSISVQAALLGAAEVYAIEQRPGGVELIQRNAEKFGVTVHVLHGVAPDVLTQIPPCTKCFIGGSGGKLADILHAVHGKLSSGGILVANFILVKNMVICQEVLTELNFQQRESRLIQTAIVDNLGLMRGNNPVFLVKGEKM